MKKIGGILFVSLCAALMLGCGAPAANNTNVNTNSNANSKPVASAPTAETLLALDKDATEKYLKGDGAAFETILSDKVVMSNGKEQMGKADIVAAIKTVKCEGGTVNLSDPKMSKINDDTYAIVYKDNSTGKCTENGKTEELKPMTAATIWVRNGDKWQAAWHGENPVMTAAPAAGDKSGEAKDEKPAAKSEEKPAAPAADAKKEEKPAANAAANNSNAAAPAPAKLTASPNTDALTKAHAAGWEAFRNKDAKAFETMMASSFIGVAPDGSIYADRASAIKEWTGAGTMKCEGITKTSFTDGFAWALSPTVEILFGKGNADGKCDGHANGDLWTAAAYVKEGDAWKLAFMFERMPGGGM